MQPEAYQFEKLSDTLEICVSDAHKFGTDAFLLSHFARARRIDRCADLGTGCGIVALLWYRDREEGPVHTDCVDIQPLAIHQLEVTVKRRVFRTGYVRSWGISGGSRAFPGKAWTL